MGTKFHTAPYVTAPRWRSCSACRRLTLPARAICRRASQRRRAAAACLSAEWAAAVDFDPPAPPDQFLQWPACPRCGQRRSARCPVCGVSRTDFALADSQQFGTGQPVLLKCEDCDDVFCPDWYRLCVACGHDFGHGVQVGQSSAESEGHFRSLSAIVIALVATALALAAYFAWLFAGRIV